eukprot:4062552-Pyramimonas_sp.AAC.1
MEPAWGLLAGGPPGGMRSSIGADGSQGQREFPTLEPSIGGLLGCRGAPWGRLWALFEESLAVLGQA